MVLILSWSKMWVHHHFKYKYSTWTILAWTHFKYTDLGIFGLHIITSWMSIWICSKKSVDSQTHTCVGVHAHTRRHTCTYHLRNASEPKWSAIIEASTSSSIDITSLWHLPCISLDHLHCFGSKQMLRGIYMLSVSIVIYLLPFIFFTQIWNMSVNVFLFHFHLLIIEKTVNKYVPAVLAEYKWERFQV